jgi:HD superfamily phosphohydrolase
MRDVVQDRPSKLRRFRDPVYDLYTFEDDIDQIALALIDTPAFQRLRRIKQLGFADHVYPGASHSRFAHSLGVYAGARMIVKAIQARKDKEDLLDPVETEDAVLAALLHDVGHGPFSHVFEKVHRRALGLDKSHEAWTREIILHQFADPEGRSIFSTLRPRQAARIADLLGGNRTNCWSAIVASALDADTLDYVRRDRLMSGTGTGAIDFTWLLEHARLAEVDVNGSMVRTFAVNRRALQQAETFLLARYQLYDQVYFHKICRGFECMLVACVEQLASLVAAKAWTKVGLAENNALVRHLRHPTVDTYLLLDDAVMNATLLQIAHGASDEAADIALLARRIVNREKAHCVDLESWASIHGKRYSSVVKCAITFAKGDLGLQPGRTVFFDEPSLSVYGKGRREDVALHKKLWIDTEDERPVEITALSGVIKGQPAVRKIGRLFFLDEGLSRRTKEYLNCQVSNLPDQRRTS